MKETISYILITPYTIIKSRIGGVLARLLSRVDLEFIGAQMFAPDQEFVNAYADLLITLQDKEYPKTAELLSDYVRKNLAPSGNRNHRCMILLFKGINPCEKLTEICGTFHTDNEDEGLLTGETIRDTYSDLILDRDDPSKVIYFEPAVLTPRNQEYADSNLKLFAKYLKNQANIVENMVYPDSSIIERTLVIIKPDNWKYASSKPGTIIDMFSRTGLRIVGVKLHRISVAESLEFYGPVKDVLVSKLSSVFGEKAKDVLEREFNIKLTDSTKKILCDSFGNEYAIDQFNQIVEFMSGRKPDSCPEEEMNALGTVKCMILIYEGENAIAKIRNVLGPTDPLKAPSGTIRREFGSNVMINTAHASDSVENAKREMGIVKIEQNRCVSIINQYLESGTC